MKKLYIIKRVALVIGLLSTSLIFATNSNSATKETNKETAATMLYQTTPPVPTIHSQTCTSVTIQNSGTIPPGEMWYWQGTLKKGTSTAFPATSTYTVTASGFYYIRPKNLITNTWGVGSAILVTVGSAGAPTWYADTDGDGLGDISSPLVQCTQPTGYVSNSDDQCPTQHGNGSATGCPVTYSLSNENYVYTITAQKATTDIENTLNNDRDNVIESVAYFDGLGRPVQSIGVRQSPNKKDIVTHMQYDQYGRQTKEYLPYASLDNDGYYKTGTLAATEAFYNTAKYQNTTNPYSEKVLENSALGRIFEQTAPGNDWLKGANQVSGKEYSDGHSIRFEYDVNHATEVRKYTVSLSFANDTYTPTLTGGTGHYPLGVLSKTITKDENWVVADGVNHTTEEFTNISGQVILKRTYNNSQSHDTYYIYDDYGNLSYVIPPKAEGSISIPTSTVLSELCYQYKYDHRNRLVEKKIPGKGWESIIYDKLDRPVLTQDAIQASNNEWLFTKYDQLGRMIYTGIYDHGSSSTRAAMQSTFSSQNDAVFDQYETKVSSGTGFDNTYYTNNNFPTSNLEVLTVNYYDNYSFNLAGGTAPTSVYTVTPTTNTAGLATGSRVKVLDVSPAKWITTVSYYDEKAQPIYVYSKNDYLGTTDIAQNKLHFTGRVEETTSTHENVNDTGNNVHTLIDAFTYDHAGRLLTQTNNINGAATSEVIVSNLYDELGQLESKGVGGKTTGSRLQTVDYTYNIRGWLTNINNDANNDNDLFNFNLKYNDIADTSKKLFNGNISQTSWNTLNTDTSTKTYTYSYDALNRITSGIANNANYNLTSVSYDKNGNILNLQRQGHTNSNATTFGVMDNLTYAYDTGNKLLAVSDAGNGTYGFKDGSNSGNDYSYDANGNMKSDQNKNIQDILYNHLNLPTFIEINSGPDEITYVYDATGVKLRKIVMDDANQTTKTTDYAGNFMYEDNKLQFFNTAEGYVKHTNASGYEYVYQYKDHLGNIRVSYTDTNQNNLSAVNLEIIEESNYYPFGLKHKGYNNVVTSNGNSVGQKKLYNGKELQDEVGLNWYDYGARNYDAALGRWFGLDALAEDYVRWSPYTYAMNNPIFFIDPDGNRIKIGSSYYEYEEGRQYDQINEDERDLYKALDYLYSTGAMVLEINGKKVNVLKKLIEHKTFEVDIFQNNLGIHSFDPLKSKKFIQTDLTAGYEFYKDHTKPFEGDNIGSASPVEIFAHEIIHAYNFMDNALAMVQRFNDIETREKLITTDEKKLDVSFKNEEEKYTTTLANQIHEKLGGDKRTNYGADIIRTENFKSKKKKKQTKKK